MEFNYKDIDGWWSDADAQFIYKIIKDINNGKIIEIGCFKGRSTASWIKKVIANNNEIFIIDNFYGGINPDAEASKIQRKEGNKIKEIFMANMKKLGINRSDYGLYKSDSIEASALFADSSIDMVFIDGDHEYKSVKKDIETYWQKLKIGGILSGHDFQNKDVRLAVEELAGPKSLEIKTGGNCFAVIKNE